MASVTIRGGLINAVLRTTTAHHRPEGKHLAGGFADQLVGSIKQNARVPQRLALTSDKNCIPDFQVNNWIEQCQSKGNVVWIGQCFGLRQLGGCTVAGLALDVLDLCFIRMNIAVTHGFGACMTINAVQSVFAFCKLGNRLIVVMQTIGWLVGSLDERHRAQVIVAAVMAGITLRIRDGRRQLMDLAFWKRVDVWGMAGGTTGQPVEWLTGKRLGVNMTVKTIGRKFLDEWVGLRGWIENLKGRHTRLRYNHIIGHSVDAEASRQVGFGSEGIEHGRYCTCIRGLHAAHHALDMILVIGSST